MKNTNALVPVEKKVEDRRALQKMTKAQLVEYVQEQHRLRIEAENEVKTLTEQVLEMRAIMDKVVDAKEYAELRNKLREDKMGGWMTL